MGKFVVIVREEMNWPEYRELKRSPEFLTKEEANAWREENIQPSSNPYREVVIEEVRA